MGKKGLLIHSECEELISYVSEPVCMRCGKELKKSEENEAYCSDCREGGRYFDRGAALINYDSIMIRSMSAIKNRHKREYLDFYGRRIYERLGKKIKAMDIDAFIPVPVHPERKRLRGYNQAEELSLILSRYMNIPSVSDILIRRKKTAALKNLGEGERRKSLNGAFDALRKLEKRERVCIVDDIYTTGSTVEACAKELLAAGASEVFFICVCIGCGRK